MKENVVLFGKSQSLVGIVSEPEEITVKAKLPGVILLNAGLLHRVGPNRLYVKVARALARQGFVVLRFDFSGMGGDSRAREDHLPVEKSVVDDVQQAMIYLTRSKGIEQFLLIGHCSGAGISLLTASQDDRVIGTILMNPQGTGEEWKTHDRNQKWAQYYTHYYSKAAFTDSQRWIRFVKGDVDYRSIARNVFQTVIWNKLATLNFRLKNTLLPKKAEAVQLSEQSFDIVQEVHRLAERGVQILFIFSEGNSGLEYIQTIFGKRLTSAPLADKLKLNIIPESDHLFTLLASQKKVTETIQAWTQAVVSDFKQAEPVSFEGYK